jgi:hypothetical protein
MDQNLQDAIPAWAIRHRALQNALVTLARLGYRWRETSPNQALTAFSPHYPVIQISQKIHLLDDKSTSTSFVFTWSTPDCEDERLAGQDPARGAESALRAVANAINAERSRKFR